MTILKDLLTGKQVVNQSVTAILQTPRSSTDVQCSRSKQHMENVTTCTFVHKSMLNVFRIKYVQQIGIKMHISQSIYAPRQWKFPKECQHPNFWEFALLYSPWLPQDTVLDRRQVPHARDKYQRTCSFITISYQKTAKFMKIPKTAIMFLSWEMLQKHRQKKIAKNILIQNAHEKRKRTSTPPMQNRTTRTSINQ